MNETTTVAQQLADFALTRAGEGVPDEVTVSVRRRVLDTLGLCVAAHRLPTSAAAIDHVTASQGRPEAGIIGTRERVPAASAAFANGVLAHSLDYDDTHLPSVLHPSSTVIPAALAVINEVFTPTPEEVDRARRVLAVLGDGPGSRGVGVDDDGGFVDEAVARNARDVLGRAERGDPAGDA